MQRNPGPRPLDDPHDPRFFPPTLAVACSSDEDEGEEDKESPGEAAKQHSQLLPVDNLDHVDWCLPSPPRLPDDGRRAPDWEPLEVGLGEEDRLQAPPPPPEGQPPAPDWEPLHLGLGKGMSQLPPALPEGEPSAPDWDPLHIGLGEDDRTRSPLLSPVVEQLVPDGDMLDVGLGEEGGVSPPLPPPEGERPAPDPELPDVAMDEGDSTPLPPLPQEDGRPLNGWGLRSGGAGEGGGGAPQLPLPEEAPLPPLPAPLPPADGSEDSTLPPLPPPLPDTAEAAAAGVTTAEAAGSERGDGGPRAPLPEPSEFMRRGGPAAIRGHPGCSHHLAPCSAAGYFDFAQLMHHAPCTMHHGHPAPLSKRSEYR